MARKRTAVLAPVAADPKITAQALAKAVAEGDIVGFRLVFAPFSPARDNTSEDFSSGKYSNLLVDEELERTPEYATALEIIEDKATWAHIQGELQAARPACLPSGPLMLLADNAVRLGKPTAAAQAYELLRIRERMQLEMLDEADRLLAAGEIERAAKGYDIASGLNYDYAGFPDPVPMGFDYQTRALILHGEYPRHLEDCVAALPAETFIGVALEYLLNDRNIAKRLLEHPLERKLAFLHALIHRRDPQWDEFAARFREACTLMEPFAAALASGNDSVNGRISLQNEVDVEQAGDPWVLPAALLGRELENGQWWQYLKELAVKHPAAPLFIARQLLGEVEVLVPRLPVDSPIPRELGLPADAGGVITATT